MASMRVQGLEDEALKGVGPGEGAVPLLKNFVFFFISKWYILVNAEVLNLNYVILLGDILIDVPPNHNIFGDVSPASPAVLTPVGDHSYSKTCNKTYNKTLGKLKIIAATTNSCNKTQNIKQVMQDLHNCCSPH